MIQQSGSSVFLVACLLTGLVGCNGDCEHDTVGVTTPPVSTSSNISLQYDDGTPYDFEDVTIFVDGLVVGLTEAGGKLQYSFPPGDHEVRALHAGTSQALAIREGSTTLSTFTITMRGDLRRPATLSSPHVSGGYLPRGITGDLDLELLGSAGLPVDLVSFTVKVQDAKASGLQQSDVTDLFEVSGLGVLSTNDIAGVFARFGDFVNDIEVIVQGVDSDGAEVGSQLNLYFGQHSLEITLEAPPSALGLAIMGHSLRARLIGSNLVFNAETDVNGRVQFSDLPTGTYDILSQTIEGGLFYTAAHAQLIVGDGVLGLVMLGLEDVLNGVPVVSVPIVSEFSPSAGGRRESISIRPTGGDVFEAKGGIQVTGGAQDEVMVVFAELGVPQGTSAVGLSYEITSEEYPEFVQEQSAYNDNWTVRVLGPTGELLFSQVRNVNTQLAQAPLWIPGTNPGSTGSLSEQVELGNLADAGSTSVYLVISSTNVGDRLNPTTAHASMVAVNPFRIRAIQFDSVAPDFSCGVHSQTQSKRSSQYSFPYAGDLISPQHNTVQRDLLVEVIGLGEFDVIDRVVVNVVHPGTDISIAQVIDEAPSATGRVRLEAAMEGNFLRLQVTSDVDQPSLIPAVSFPPLDRFEYQISIEATPGQVGGAGQEGVQQLVATKASPVLTALWKAELDARTGCREEGGDDWARQGTVLWLNDNVDLLPPVDNIMGEHDRGLGQIDHEKGKGIDVRQFPGTILNMDSGLKNYIILRDDVRLAMDGDTSALTRLDDWFVLNRQGLEGLVGTFGVSQIYVALSPAEQTLPADWFRDLLVAGTISTEANEISLPSGAWKHPFSGRLDSRRGHLDHYHIGLN